MLLIYDGSEGHPTHHKTLGINLPEAQCQQVKDDRLATAGRLDCDEVVTVEQAVDGKNLQDSVL